MAQAARITKPPKTNIERETCTGIGEAAAVRSSGAVEAAAKPVLPCGCVTGAGYGQDRLARGEGARRRTGADGGGVRVGLGVSCLHSLLTGKRSNAEGEKDVNNKK